MSSLTKILRRGVLINFTVFQERSEISPAETYKVAISKFKHEHKVQIRDKSFHKMNV